MYNELLKQRIIIEFANLFKNVQSDDNDRDAYAQFMKEVFLNTSGLN